MPTPWEPAQRCSMLMKTKTPTSSRHLIPVGASGKPTSREASLPHNVSILSHAVHEVLSRPRAHAHTHASKQALP